MSEKAGLIGMTAEIVSAYVGHNDVPAEDISGLIHKVYTALVQAESGAASHVERPEPAISTRKSITPDYLVCLEDGKKFKSLKRHLRTHYNLSPEEYREKWNLPRDYPMVAPNYAQARSKLAKKMGLGQKGRRRTVRRAAAK
ncbi:MucR family transcriptional regulator [Parvibaculum sp.]|uniref:MucR family transcriptional regulator n=1 Tax=Parvibaculum sp. TaxID=2024848 RepID=UPI00320F8814